MIVYSTVLSADSPLESARIVPTGLDAALERGVNPNGPTLERGSKPNDAVPRRGPEVEVLNTHAFEGEVTES